MIKRPCVWFLLAYIYGSLLFGFSPYILIISLILILSFVIVYQIRFPDRESDRFLFLLPILILCGYLFYQNQAMDGPMDSLIEQELYCVGTGTVATITETKQSNRILLKDVTFHLNQQQFYYCQNIIVYQSDVSAIKIGNLIEVTGKLSKFTSPTNLGQFDEKTYYQMLQIDYRMFASGVRVVGCEYSAVGEWLYRMRCSLKQRYYELLDEEDAAIICALTLGEKSLMDDEIKSLYQSCGIAHILAISGLHISILGVGLFRLLQRMRFGLKGASIVTIFAIFAYGILTNFSVSTNRAIIMLILAFIGRMIGRTYDFMTGICISGLIILFQEPMLVKQSGFQLSFGAVCAIAVLVPIFQQTFHTIEGKKRVIHRLADSLIVSISVFLFTIPILLWNYYEVSLYSIFLNLLVIPPMTYLVAVAIACIPISILSLELGQIIGKGVEFILSYYETLCNIVKKLPYSTLTTGKPEVISILCYYLFLILILSFLSWKKQRRYCCLLPLLFLLFLPLKSDDLTITYLDVGQGDCICIETPNHHTFLMDGGSTSVNQVGKYRLIPFLKAKAIRTIDCILISHTDEDHISGIKELVEGMPDNGFTIHRFLLPRTNLVEKTYEDLVSLVTSKGIEITYMNQGNQIKDGDVTLECLHPGLEYQAIDKNSYSLVLGLSYESMHVLLTGDVTESGELAMKEKGLLKEYDVLKVAHHGSKHSSRLGFLEAVSPTVGIISCDLYNDYGHPHEDTLNRLSNVGTKVYATAWSGAITIRSDGEKLWCEEYADFKQKHNKMSESCNN